MPGPARCLVRGSICIDESYQVKDIVRPGETISSTTFERRPGGKGANQAVAIAKALGTSGKVDLECCVGEDGRWLLRELEKMGVYAGGVAVVQEPTGRAIIQVAENGENSIVLFKGANYAKHPSSPAQIFSLGITHLLLQNEVPLSSTLAYLNAAPHNVSTIFNPSPSLTHDELAAFPWHNLSWLILNAHEAHALLHALNAPHAAAPLSSAITTAASKAVDSLWPRTPPPALVKALRGTEASAAPERGNPSLSMPALWPDIAPPALLEAYTVALQLARHAAFSPSTNVVCTLGEFGVLAVIPSLAHPIYMPAAKGVEVRDTTAAGDCFTGYLVAGLMERYERVAPMGEAEMTELLRRCVQAAGMCVERRGAMESIPTAAEVDAKLG